MIERLTPNAYKAVTPYVIPSPVGIDRVITNLQVAFSSLTWLEKSFGKANKAIVHVEDQGEVIIPSILVSSSNDPVDLLANDNWDAYSFFYGSNPQENEAYGENIDNVHSKIFSCIFWFNLQRVDADKLYDFREELILEVSRLISKTSVGEGNEVEILRVHVDELDIFDGFSVDLLQSQALAYPQSGFRIEMKAYYQDAENC